ncbi:MAG: hypothetical protein ABI193_17420, partial [Minicystis sp.]
IERPNRRVELWIADAITGRLSERAVVLPSPNDDEDSQTVRASEQLRAFFQPLATHLTSAPPPPALPSPARALPAIVAAPLPPSHSASPVVTAREIFPGVVPRRSRFLVAADLAVPFQPGGLALNLGLCARWKVRDPLALGAFASVPLVSSTLTAAEGSASLSAALFGLDLGLHTRLTPGLRLGASAGLALAWLRTIGVAAPPYAGKASDALFALPIVGAEISPRLHGPVSLVFDARLGVALPRADLVFAGRPVASWGRPLGMIGAGVSVDL